MQVYGRQLEIEIYESENESYDEIENYSLDRFVHYLPPENYLKILLDFSAYIIYNT